MVGSLSPDRRPPRGDSPGSRACRPARRRVDREGVAGAQVRRGGVVRARELHGVAGAAEDDVSGPDAVVELNDLRRMLAAPVLADRMALPSKSGRVFPARIDGADRHGDLITGGDGAGDLVDLEIAGAPG